LPCLVARPCAVYGTPPDLARFRRWSLIPFDFPRQAIDAGRIVLQSHGLQRRNFVPAEGVGSLVGWWLGQPARGLVANAPGKAEAAVLEFARLCARIVQEETGRAVEVVHPPAPGALPPPLEYRTRVGGHLPGPTLEEHVRGLVRTLAAKASP
jgi:UDP-glucose 4-epimerase